MTALEACENVPSMEVVTIRLLNEERKQGGKDCTNSYDEKAMTTLPRKFTKRGPCFNCGKL